jgi:putative GTP pyrophosphokinase
MAGAPAPSLLLDEAAISAELGKRERSYVALAGEARFIVEERIADEGIKIHAVESRVKTYDSIIQKCKIKQIRDPFSELNDIVGVRAICLFRSDLVRIDRIIKAEFDLHLLDDKVMADVDSFGYMSVHYIVSLRSTFSGPRYEKIKGIRFEIQVRTLAMHAWAAISHYLAYKGEWDVPDSLKKSLNALSGLFYVADGEFERFFIESEKSRSDAERSVPSKEINLDTVRVLLLQKYVDRTQSSDSDLSNLVKQIKDAGYTNLNDVEIDIDRAANALIQYEKTSPSILAKRRKGYFEAVGAARVSLGIASHKFADLTEENLGYERYRAFLT